MKREKRTQKSTDKFRFKKDKFREGSRFNRRVGHEIEDKPLAIREKAEFGQGSVVRKYWITAPDELRGFSYSKNLNNRRDEPDTRPVVKIFLITADATLREPRGTNPIGGVRAVEQLWTRRRRAMRLGGQHADDGSERASPVCRGGERDVVSSNKFHGLQTVVFVVEQQVPRPTAGLCEMRW